MSLPIWSPSLSTGTGGKRIFVDYGMPYVLLGSSSKIDW